jgi:hypothetical protein
MNLWACLINHRNTRLGSGLRLGAQRQMRTKKDKTDLALTVNESVGVSSKTPKYETGQRLKTQCTKTDANEKGQN